jgi:hypothetical protein
VKPTPSEYSFGPSPWIITTWTTSFDGSNIGDPARILVKIQGKALWRVVVLKVFVWCAVDLTVRLVCGSTATDVNAGSIEDVLE